MNPSEIFIRRPVMTMLVMLSALVFGVISFIGLPVNDLPAVDYPVIQVQVAYPGADPTTMAANVATPLEKQFMQIQGLEIITSSSTQGNTQMVLQFNLDKNIGAAATDVQAAITRATGNLPKDLPSPPTFTLNNPNDQPIVYLALTSDSLTAGQLYDYANNQVGQRISIISGVSQVNIYGAPRAVRIDVDPNAVSLRGLSMNDVTAAVQQGTVSLGVGQYDGKHKSFIINPRGQLENAEDYESLIISYKNGTPVYLRDVAVCRESIAVEHMQMNFWARGLASKNPNGVVIAINRAAGSNAVKVAGDIVGLLPSIRQTLPGSMQLIVIHNRADTIVGSVNDVKETLLIAFVLVVAVIFIFLGRATDTIIPAVALPLSLLLTFIGMGLLGYSLDNLSLMALTLAVGFLVDDAIVFLENAVRLMEAGENPMQAALKGAREISFTIVSMTVSLAAVFIPLVFMAGLMGRVFREFAMTIIIAIFASGFVSLTLTPLMCSRMLAERDKNKKTFFERIMDKVMGVVLKTYDSSLTFFLRHGWTSILTWVICLIGTFYLFMILPKTFLPVGDSSLIMGVFIADEESSPEQMITYQQQVDRVLQSNDNVNMSLTVSNIGSFMTSSQAFTLAFLKDREKRQPIEKVAQELTMQLFQIPGIFPAIRAKPVLQISTGATSENQGNYAFVISGADTDQVNASAMKLMEEMQKIPGMASVSSDLHLKTPQLYVNMKRDPASTYGITAASIEQTLRSAYSQNYAYLIKSPIQQYQVIVETDQKYRAHPEDLKLLYLNSISAPDLVPMNTVTDTKEILGPQAVNHTNQFPSVTIFFDLLPGAAIGEITEKINKLSDSVLPPELLRSFQGEAQVFSEATQSLAILMIMAVFIMYIILGILYESYLHPLTVLSALPVATVGGLLTLLLFGSELSIYASVGLFLLMGIVKKNGIMMIDFALQRMGEGMERYDAIKEACRERFRPIIMTTLAALMGALPIAFGYGNDGASRQPLGLVIVGGLIVSQFLTLYVTPVIFLYFETFQEKVLDRIPFFRAHPHARTPDPAVVGPTAVEPTVGQ